MKTIKTVNYHLTKACNFKCKYCFARFESITEKVSRDYRSNMVRLIAASQRFRKINFAGGEPTLVPYLGDLIRIAKESGMETSVVTNGSLINEDWIQGVSPYLDILAISIDSSMDDTNLRLGCCSQGKMLDLEKVKSMADYCHKHGIYLKINTVVSAFNKPERMTDLINVLHPNRWKILQATKVEGENDRHFDSLKVTTDEFVAYCTRNRFGLLPDIVVAAESSEVMAGSYIMIDGEGRFFDSSDGRHRYSSPIMEIGVDAALSQIHVDADKFESRGGNYEIRKPMRMAS